MKTHIAFGRGSRYAGTALLAMLLIACEKPAPNAERAATSEQAGVQTSSPPTAEKVELVHVHGLAYTPDGDKLMIPSHFGLAIYDGSRWTKAPGPEHDYMGFAATHNAFYSSGHPAQGSDLVNPFGLMKSTDGGQTWEKLGLQGESDFHHLAAGYRTNAVYVVNYHANSKMNQPGIYSTLNDGNTWQLAASRGLDGPPSAIAVHPSNPQKIAAGMKSGLYLSENGGNDFFKVYDGQVLAVSYDLDGEHLWFSAVEDQAALVRVELNGKGAEKIAVPPMEKDGIAYIAQNPARTSEYAIATFRRSVYVTPDGGKTWRQIAQDGQTL
jgi:photosystem II stability/assembly factor-like uncharacterized protein